MTTRNQEMKRLVEALEKLEIKQKKLEKQQKKLINEIIKTRGETEGLNQQE